MIPQNISRKDILEALEDIKNTGIQKSRKSRKYHINYDGNNYPPKLVLSLANKFANGYELTPEDFGGGKETNDFLIRLGFKIIEDYHQLEEGEPVEQTPNRKQKHSERCKECKESLYKFLNLIFGEVKQNYQLDIGTRIEDYSSHHHYEALKHIYQNLSNFRGNDEFVRTDKLPKVDYFIVSENCIVEYDESQHFTQLRRITLEKYPENLEIGFDKNKWATLCNKYNSKDTSPVYRDEQRAWYDTLRDFSPGVIGLNPTIRLHASEETWCRLDIKNENDVSKFKEHLGFSREKYLGHINVKISKSNSAKIGRIILASNWASNLNKARNVLHKTCDNWPNNIRVNFLITPGAFLGFDLPYDSLRELNNKEPSGLIQKQLFCIAEESCKELLTTDLKKELQKHTRYITLGIDSFKSKVSLSNVQIRNPHAEFIALYDLIEDKYFWTGKSFPTIGQEDGLIRITDINSHFINTEFGKTMILGCHDLSVYSNRGKTNTKSEWRKRIRYKFRESAKNYSPEIVLHHPHNTDSIKTWSASWGELKRDLPNIKYFAGSGKYFRTEGKQRSELNDVLESNRMGDTLDFVIYGN